MHVEAILRGAVVASDRPQDETAIIVHGMDSAIKELSCAELILGILFLELCEWQSRVDTLAAQDQVQAAEMHDGASVATSAIGDAKSGVRSFSKRGLSAAWHTSFSSRVRTLRAIIPQESAKQAEASLRRSRQFSLLSMRLGGGSTRSLALFARASSIGGTATISTCMLGEAAGGPGADSTKLSGSSAATQDLEMQLERSNAIVSSVTRRIWLLRHGEGMEWLQQARAAAAHACLQLRSKLSPESMSEPEAGLLTVMELPWYDDLLHVGGDDMY